MAKGGVGGGGGSGLTPVVNATDPSSAPQDVRLDVRVLGSNFDDGSTVRFLLNGKGTTTIVVNGTSYVSAGELRADVTVSLDAIVDRYDVEVTSRGGKKGIGIEKFEVTGPTADLPVAVSGSPDGLYADGMGLYEGGILTNPQENGGSSGNFNFKAFCDEGRAFDIRLPWPIGISTNCYGSERVNLHFPGLLFQNTDCPDPGCPIGEPPRKRGGFGPAVNYFVSVSGNDEYYNVVWTNATYLVLRRASSGAPCEWRVRGSLANLHDSGNLVPVSVGGAVALDVTVTRYDGACSE
jgi:hypothetical protein